jgi:hypothetical protein
MADTSGWITIKQMAQEILFETGRDPGFYKRCMHHVINGVREMNKFHYDNVKTTKVTANSLGIIDLPSDFIKEIRLAMNYGGLMYDLTRQDMMVRTFTDNDSDGSLSLDSTIGEGVALDKGGDYQYRTLGAKNDYYYTFDYTNNRILVRNTPTRTLFLQYISSGFNETDGNGTSIPVKIKEALKSYVLYKDALMSDRGNKQLVGIYKQEYHEEVSKLHFLELPSAQELQDILYSTYSEVRR